MSQDIPPESTELAFVTAYVGVVDVTVDNIGHLIMCIIQTIEKEDQSKKFLLDLIMNDRDFLNQNVSVWLFGPRMICTHLCSSLGRVLLVDALLVCLTCFYAGHLKLHFDQA